MSKVKYAIYKDNYKLITTTFPQIRWSSNYKELISKGEKFIHDTKVTTVMWRKPPYQWVKINSDGSALNNPGRLGAVDIIRDQKGEMLLAFATPLGEGTNNKVELEAAIFGMTLSLELGYNKIILEVDSQFMVDWIMHKAEPHWSINTQMLKLQALIRHTHKFKCNHTLKEANFVADSLSKHSHKITSPQLYFNNHQIPK
ncbi:uncharacterized protein LOC125868450 [Solanum stenotomum]|uniref:uncharacterized protein LOC125868450 n=1 Tax=Solanum stenotomum TaxID=172797 RepID=UPI0020D116E0|nr:uncharacterized protein LOC125868450 [Solanum stenotomum]